MNENSPLPLAPSPQDNEIILYQPDSTIKIEVRLENETVWLTQQQIADLFGTKRPAITKHLANIYKSGELEENSTCSILEHVGNYGSQRYITKYYNLDAMTFSAPRSRAGFEDVAELPSTRKAPRVAYPWRSHGSS